MYVQERGVPASSYNKAQLIILAKAVFKKDLPVDSKFENDNLTTPRKTKNFAQWHLGT